LALSPVFLWLAFRGIPAGSLGAWITNFSLGALGFLLIYEMAAFTVLGERWRFLLRESGLSVPFWRVMQSRLSGFAWSYLTPGPHIGGEPMQLLVLRAVRIPVSRSVPSLLKDRVYDFFGGILISAAIVSLLSKGSRFVWGPLIGVAAMSILVMGFRFPALRRWALRLLLPLAGKSPHRRYRMYRIFRDTVTPRVRRPVRIQIVLAASILLGPLLHIGELALFFSFSGEAPGIGPLIILASISRIAHYVPVPGGIGVVEWGMMSAVGWLGIDVGTMAAYLIFVRLRDIIQVAAGILFSLPLIRERRPA
jgi:uncharacterized protein (TIRG00374 family)